MFASMENLVKENLLVPWKESTQVIVKLSWVRNLYSSVGGLIPIYTIFILNADEVFWTMPVENVLKRFNLFMLIVKY